VASSGHYRLVAHLHAFAREVWLTEAEWEHGIDFLNRIGKATARRPQRKGSILQRDRLSAVESKPATFFFKPVRVILARGLI
jgi:Catechol dioxygenase N terminus